jgi:NADPH-dependent 2,4-dienoyl-CoA reductase/sulfur reductase-like enzyme
LEELELIKRKAVAFEKIDLVIIGAGPAGLAAAAEVGQCGGNVVVLDEAPNPGGRLPSQIYLKPRKIVAGKRNWSNGSVKAEQLIQDAKANGVRIFCSASVWGVFPGWHVAVAPTCPRANEDDLPIGLDTRALLIATGAAQNPLIMPGWTLPGVITSGAAQTLINVHRIMPGFRSVVIGIDPLSLSVAQLMNAIGIHVLGVFLPPANGLQFGPSSPQAAIQALSGFSSHAPSIKLTLAAKMGKYLSRLATHYFPTNGLKIEGFSLMLRHMALSINGSNGTKKVNIATLNPNGDVKAGTEKELETNVVITSAGLSPLVELAQVAGCPLHHIPESGGWVPIHNEYLGTPLPGLFVAGSISGVEGARVAEIQGRIAGIAAANYLKLTTRADLEESTNMYQLEMIKARHETVPFFPLIEEGQAQMKQIWKHMISK